MAAIDFPNSPAVNDLFTVDNRTWKWNGSTWDMMSVAFAHTHAMADLTSFAVTSPTTGQLLSYNGTTSKWVNADAPSGETTSPFLLMGA